MRTNIVIDQQLMEEAMRATGLKTKRAVVEHALQQLVAAKRRRSILDYAGAVPDFDVEGFEISRGHAMDESWSVDGRPRT